MAKIRQAPFPAPVEHIFKKAGLKIKKFKTAAAFEKDLLKFIKRNHVLHLSTCRDNVPRSTPLEYRPHGLTLYILSEGGVKFENLRNNKKISFSIAEPYHAEKDFFSYKGLQAWGTARVFSRKEHPRQFMEALKKMKVMKSLKQLGMKEPPPEFNYRIIAIIPERIKYGNPREGVYWTTWENK